MRTTSWKRAGLSVLVAVGGAATTVSTLASGASAAPRAGAAATVAAARTDFGTGCASVPKSGAGSFGGMNGAPVATAASGNPLLSTLVTAVKKAGLVTTLNQAKALTVFAPDNAAFAKVPSKTLHALLADKAKLTKTLEYHVVAGRILPSRLAGKHMTLEGSALSVSGKGAHFTVDGKAAVVCGNVQTSNATVYIINSVLAPPAM